MIKCVCFIYLLAGLAGVAYAQGPRPIDSSNTTFKDTLRFLKGQVIPATEDDMLTFENDTFYKWANFEETNFRQAATFSDDIFHQRAEFAGAIFNKKVTFDGSTFMEGGNFVGTQFKATTDFSFVVLTDSGWMNFQNAQLPDTINFGNLKLSPRARISLLDIAPDEARFGPHGNGHPYNIILYNTDVSQFRLDYAYFHLLPIFDQDGEELPRDQGIALYEALLKNFNDHGQKVSAEKLDIEFQQYLWHTSPHWYVRAFEPLPDWWWKFGYEKWRVFGWTAGLLLFFTLISLLTLPFLHDKVYPLKALSKKIEKDENPYSGLSRLWYSFIYTSAIFFKLTLKVEDIEFDSRPKNIIGTLYVMVVYLIGIVCIAYMANFVIQK